MLSGERHLVLLHTNVGTAPFEKWFQRLVSWEVRRSVLVKISRLQNPGFKNFKAVGGGICELRIFEGHKVFGGNIRMKLINIEESSLFNDLQNPEFAADYLESMLAEDDINSFLIAIRNIAKANGGVAQLSKVTDLGRESLYKTLSEKGNPYFSTLQIILKSMGLRFSVAIDDSDREAA